jgi:hypothetical protein
MMMSTFSTAALDGSDQHHSLAALPMDRIVEGPSITSLDIQISAIPPTPSLNFGCTGEQEIGYTK